ncbi:hypothetical protein N9272_00065 [bacterium]|jgi:hypothetical protein|nr:hypothetical protein [bacterium]
MIINNSIPLKDLQYEFNFAFPYLKIEFFSKYHKEGNGSNEQDILDNSLTIGEIRNSINDGFIPLNGDISVSVFENLFKDNFNLYVQVYRKSHGKWLQTWVTDIWTLDEQNNRGKILGDKDNLLTKK